MELEDPFLKGQDGLWGVELGFVKIVMVRRILMMALLRTLQARVPSESFVLEVVVG